MPRELLSGNQAVGEAVRLARVEVIAAYPITPQTSIIEHLAESIGKGRLDADYITVESEHSAMAACIGASLAGARTFTASSSQGLALMHEMLHWAAGQRTPVVMANVNRALGPPWSIWADHTDSLSQRDTGWLQIYAETNQEVLDTVLQAYRVAEDPQVMLPAMVMEDAFLLSHTYMPVEVPEPETLEGFLPPFAPPQQVKPRAMETFGSFSHPDVAYMELRRDMELGMAAALPRLAAAEARYAELTGRPPLGLLEEYRTEGAEAVIVTMGSMAATTRDAVDELRKEGKKVGLARLRVFRPFPHDAIRALGERFPTIGILNRAVSFGSGGPVASEIRSSLLDLPQPPRVASFIAGLGGREVSPGDIAKIYGKLLSGRFEREEWIGLREGA